MDSLFFGGSFNPIHYGHLRCAQAVAKAVSAKSVVLIPSASPPHKPTAADLAPAADRAEMCRLAIDGKALFTVSEIELNRAGPSYTLETARQLHALGNKVVNWLIGADMVRILPQWHQPEALLREVNFILMARPGWDFDWQSLPPAFRHLQSHVVEAPLVDISASEIRRRVRAGEPINGLTPDAVVEYIREHQLYR